ncbi:site-specific integrase [Polaromonas sp. P1(28)-8]|nr:site-specific integrase [Polaromonas sp. P1(28)-8]
MRATSGEVKIHTVQTEMRHLHAYANFLDTPTKSDWRHFPLRKADRVLVLWRGALIKARDAGKLASSTTSQRMSATIRFYRFAAENNLVSGNTPLWLDRPVVIRYFDSVGFSRTINVLTTDISIPNRQRHGTLLEDGLLPLSSKHMQQLLDFTQAQSNEEMSLLLKLGFFTGGRIGTLATLRIATIERATQDPKVPGLYRLSVGPSAKPAVQTKFDVNGHILIPDALLEELRTYMYSVRRSKREVLAAQENKDFVFLTRFGNSYAVREDDRSPSINRLMTDLRIKATKAGLRFMLDFEFHQTRATFGTWLMEICLGAGDPITAIGFVRDAMLHKHESTTFKYIKFINESKAKETMRAPLARPSPVSKGLCVEKQLGPHNTRPHFSDAEIQRKRSADGSTLLAIPRRRWHEYERCSSSH